MRLFPCLMLPVAGPAGAMRRRTISRPGPEGLTLTAELLLPAGPPRARSGPAFTANGHGVAHCGTDLAARADAMARVSSFFNPGRQDHGRHRTLA